MAVPNTFENAISETSRRVRLGLDGDYGERAAEGSRLIWEHLSGYLRGSIPYPVPDDLMGVAVSSAMRMTKGYQNTGDLFINRGQYNDVADFRPWTGFMLVERLILNRYRKTVA